MALWPAYEAGTARLNIEPYFGTVFQTIDARVRAHNAPPVTVKVEPDSLDPFLAALETKLNSLHVPPVKVKAKLDADNLQSDLNTQLAAASQDLTIKVNADLAQANADLFEWRWKASRPIDVKINVDTAAASSQMAGLNGILSSTNSTFDTTLNLDTAAASTQLAAFRAAAAQPIDVNLNVDTTGAAAQLAALNGLAQTLHTTLGNLPSPNTGSGGFGGFGGGSGGFGGARGRRGNSELSGGMVQRVRMRIEIDRESVAAAEQEVAQAAQRLEQARQRAVDSSQRSNLAQRRLTDTQRQNTRATDELTAAQQHLAQLQSDATTSAEDLQAAQQRVATAHDRAERSTTSLQAATQNAARAQRDATDRTRDSHRALGEQADATRRLHEAQENQGRVSRLAQAALEGIAHTAMNGAMSLAGMVSPAGLVTTALLGLAAVSLVPLIGQLVQAAGVISLLPAMGAAATATFGTLIIGMSGIGDAITAGFDAVKEGGDEAEASSKKVATAQRGVEDATKAAAKSAEQGADNIARAERGVTSAQERAKQAQEDLTRARKDAQEQIEDLNLALKGSALDEESAVLAVERARRRLQRGDFTGPDADLDRRDASLSYRQAIQRLAEVRESNADLRKETEAATAAGVEGSEQVVAAKDQIAQADQQLIDAQRQLQKATEDAAEANADAQQRILDAQVALNEALDDTGTKTDAFGDAMDGLSENAQDFVLSVLGMQDAWNEFKWSLQDELFDGMGDSLERLGSTYLPILTEGLGGLADVLNTKLRGAMDWLMEDAQVAGIDAILQNTTAALGPLLDGIGNLGRALFDLSVTGSEFLPGMTESFENSTGSFADMIHRMATTLDENGESQLHNFMQNAIDTFDRIWEIIKNIGELAAGIFEGSDQVGDSWLENIETATEKWAAFFDDPQNLQKVKDFFDDVKDTVDALATSLGYVADIFGKDNKDEDGDPAPPKLDLTGAATGGIAGESNLFNQAWQRANGPGLWRWLTNDNNNGAWGETKRSFNDWFGWFEGDTALDSEKGPVYGPFAPQPDYEAQLQEQLNSGNVEGGSLIGDPSAWAEKFGQAGDAIKGTWDDKIYPALSGVVSKAGEIGGAFLSDIGDTASSAWNGLTDKVRTGWNEHIAPAWETLKTEGLGGLADYFTEKITDGAVTSWQELPSAIFSGAGEIVDKHFPWLSSGLDTLTGAFREGIDGIGSLWDGLRDKLATPIDWVISNVFNDGIIKFWNAVAPKIGLETIEPIGLIGQGGGKSASAGKDKIQGLATGGLVDGVMSGYSPGVDDRLIAVGGGEAVMRPEWTRAVGHDYVNEANRAARTGGVEGVRQFIGAYAGGGIVMDGVQITTAIQQSMWDKIREAFPDIYLTSATRTEDMGYGWDFHMGGQAIDLDGPNKQGYADWIANAFPDALELFWDPGPNIDEGRPTGAIGGHSDHVHWAMDYLVGDVDQSLLERAWGAVKSGARRASSFFRNLAADAFETPLNALVGTIPDPFPGIGDFGKMPKAAASTLAKAAIEMIRGKASEKDNASGSAAAGSTPWDIGAGAEQWRQVVLEALQRTGHDPADADIVLKQIQIESSGDPNAINLWDSNAAKGTPSKGLIQTIDPTFQSHRDPSLPNDPYDPLANIVAGIRYADAEYGHIRNIWPKTMGYDAGGVLPDDAMALNTSGAPEYVLTNDEWKLIEEFVALIGRPDFIAKLAGSFLGPKEPGLFAPKDFAGTYEFPQGSGTYQSPVLTADSSTATLANSAGAGSTDDGSGYRQFQTQPDGSLSEADMLANMAPEARATFEQNGQGAPGGDGFNFEAALAETTGITIDHRPVEERMADWATTYSGKWANWGKETAGELIDDALSPLGLGISVGQIVTQDVPEAMTRMARLADMAARGYTRTMGR